MILSELIQYLSSAPRHKIEFLLPDGRTIPSHYHLTEVARVRKDLIDCGGGLRQLEYCTLQLWATFDLEHRLSTEKFLSILDKSNTVLTNQEIEAEIEYEDKIISQYPIDTVQSSNGKLVVQLTTKHTDCLAKDACGVNPNTVKQPGCTPGTGCC